MALEVRSLKRSYGDFQVSLDLTVDDGETLVLVGPSGSGKTTALNLIAGLAQPDSGTVIIGGENITGLPPWKRNISVVFQDLALFPHLDVGGNIAYGLFLKNVPRKERRRIVEETLKTVRLPGYASRRINTLSGGERQRVAIARSLASSPRALLLDEPFSSLDAPLRKALRREFLEIRSHPNAPCIFVTHDREEAVMLGDRVALMTNGHIVETARGRDIFLAPQTEAAARFFGAGQVLPAAVLEKSEAGIVVSSALGILTVPAGTEYNPGRPLLFIPRDAFVAEASGQETGAAPGLKPFNARFTGSLFEGQSLILKVLLEPQQNDRNEDSRHLAEAALPRPDAALSGQSEPIPLEISASPRVKLPAPGSVVAFRVDQNLLRFVR